MTAMADARDGVYRQLQSQYMAWPALASWINTDPKIGNVRFLGEARSEGELDIWMQFGVRQLSRRQTSLAERGSRRFDVRCLIHAHVFIPVRPSDSAFALDDVGPVAIGDRIAEALRNIFESQYIRGPNDMRMLTEAAVALEQPVSGGFYPVFTQVPMKFEERS